jgi:hypothetical protein
LSLLRVYSTEFSLELTELVVASYHSSVVKVLPILVRRADCPPHKPPPNPLTDENTDASLCIGSSDVQTYGLVSLTRDGY